MPALIGYIVTGMLVANYWGGMSEETMRIIEFLADLGMVLLMFCIGMEMNLSKMKKSGMFAMMVVLILVPVMIFGGYFVGSMLGWSVIQSLFLGAILAGSSTAVVTLTLKENSYLSKGDSDTIILISIVEDIAQVLLLSTMSPLLTGGDMSVTETLYMLIIVVLFVVISMVLGIKFIPRILDWLGAKMPSEILLIMALGMCFCMALISVVLGLSMAIGAFIMGIIVSQSKMRRPIEHDVTPMKDIFMSMFFISIGLAISPWGIWNNLPLILLLFIAYNTIMFCSVFLAYFLGNRPIKLSFLSAMSLVAMGEFAFIIAKEALDANVISGSIYTSVVGAALLTMIFLPMIGKISDKIYLTLSTKLPKPILSTAVAVVDTRDKFYTKLALTSKATSELMTKKVTRIYVWFLSMIVIEFVMMLTLPMVVSYLDVKFPDVNLSLLNISIMLVNFALLLYPLYRFFSNLKFVERVIVNNERKIAEAAGPEYQFSLIAAFHHWMLKINIYHLVVVTNLLIVLFVPMHTGFTEHVIATVIGLAIVALIYLVHYIRKD